jgi:acetaldehyde dehydrogenase (acetylating)
MGHTMSIHSRNEDVILQFGLKKPAGRICVNTPTTLGSIGLTTGLDPAMTLGCGGWGGNITSDNISPRHLLNIKRLAYETRPVATGSPQPPAPAPSERTLPKSPSRPVAEGIPATVLAERIDQFLSSRGYVPSAPPSPAPPVARPPAAPAAFICEDDVRDAVRAGQKLVVGQKTIVTPAARDLASQHDVFIEAGWPPGS